MNPNENQNLNQPPQPEAPQATVPPAPQPPMPTGMPMTPMAAVGTAAGVAAGSSIVTWIVIAVTTIVMVGGGIGGYVYYRNNYGNVSTIVENTLSNEENTKLINKNVDAYFKAQKEKNPKELAKYLPQEITDEELTEEYLNNYFKDSEEKISAVELKNVDFDTYKFDDRADNFINYPAKNKAIISVSLTRSTNYLGTETRSVYEIPVVFRKSWKVVATDTLVPKQLKKTEAADKITYMAASDSWLLQGGEVSMGTSIPSVAVFDKHIIVRADIETKTPDIGRPVSYSPSTFSIIDNEGETYRYQYKENIYPSNDPGGSIEGKSTIWFSFAPEGGKTVRNNIKKFTYQYSFRVPNIPVAGKSMDFNNKYIEIDLK